MKDIILNKILPHQGLQTRNPVAVEHSEVDEPLLDLRPTNHNFLVRVKTTLDQPVVEVIALLPDLFYPLNYWIFEF